MRTKIPFVGPSYQARSVNADCQRTLNCYVELDQASPRAPSVLYGTPGLVRKATLPAGPVRGALSAGGVTWWVAGGMVCSVDASYQVRQIGSIGSSRGQVGMASNGAQILIVDGVGGWIVDIASAVVTPIVDAAFPNGVRRCAYQDGFFLVTGDGSQKFYMNETPGDGLVWNGLDFASAEGSPDNTVGIVSNHRELWLFGDDSAEIWVNTGNGDFPFARAGNAFVEHGCAAAGTIAKADNTVFWLGADARGSGIVWRANGYTPQRISDHAVEHAIAGYGEIGDAFAFAYQQEGHFFYVLSFPSANATWVYDIATQLWHERAWRDPDTGTLSRWRANCHVFANGEHLVGDCDNGNIYALDLDAGNDDGAPLLRLRRTIAQAQTQERIFYSSLQVDMETGVGSATGQGAAPQLMLRYSDDGGHTWSNQQTATVGRQGEYGARARFNRLGAGRNRVWEISMTDPVKWAILGAVAEGEAGTS